VAEVSGPRHFAQELTALLVEVHLFGTSQRSDGVRRVARWAHRYWLVKELLMPVRITTEESTDGILAWRSLHELVAIDLLGPPAVPAR
jgi:hypothetical protein